MIGLKEEWGLRKMALPFIFKIPHMHISTTSMINGMKSI
jgi:hypothetical protein